MVRLMQELIQPSGTFYALNDRESGPNSSQTPLSAIEEDIVLHGARQVPLLQLISAVASPQHDQAEEMITRYYSHLGSYEALQLNVARAKQQIYEDPPENNKTPIATNLFNKIMNTAIVISTNGVSVDAEKRLDSFINRFIAPPAELIEAMRQMGIEGRENEVREPFQSGFLNSFGTLPKPLREYIVSDIFGFGHRSDYFYKWMCNTEKTVNPFLSADAAGSPLVMLKELIVHGVQSTEVSIDEEDLTHVQNMIAQLCRNGQFTLLPHENGVVTRLIFRNNTDGTTATATEKLARIEDLVPVDYGFSVHGKELASHQLLFKKLTSALNRTWNEGVNTSLEMTFYYGIVERMEEFKDYISHCQQKLLQI